LGFLLTQALTALAGTIHQQALVITYSECFWVLGVALVVMMPLVFLLRQPARNGQPAEMGH